MTRNNRLGSSALMILLMMLSGIHVLSQQRATIKTGSRVFKTYPYSDPNPIPPAGPLYPYFRFDGYALRPIDKAWKTIEIENEYIRIMILPEIGGKVWSAIEKKSGKPFLYENHVVKFRDIAMRGPWTSGGLEANYGIIGHAPSCASPVEYYTESKPDGSASCTIGALDLLTQTYWRMEIIVPPAGAYFITRSYWHNSNPIPQPYYHWMNAGLKADGNLQFILPGTKYIGHEGHYASWPRHENGRNLDWYNENDFGSYKSYHVFGKRTRFSGAYWHDDKHGMVRYGKEDDKAGKKIWIWGLSRQGMIWENILTDTDGQYVEMQSGRLFNQNASESSLTPFKHHGFFPYATDRWEEYWYPVLGTEGMVVAGHSGALNILHRNGQLVLKYSPVRAYRDTLRILAHGNAIYQKPVSFTPLQPFSDSIPWTGDPHMIQAIMPASGIQFSADPKADVLARPVDPLPAFTWNSAQGFFTKGKEAMDQKLFPEAVQYLDSSLKTDPTFTPALVHRAILHYRSLEYKQALALINRAMQVNTHDGEVNYYYGLVQEALNDDTNAIDGYSLATLEPAYRTPAYARLAGIYLRQKNFADAESSLKTGMYNDPNNPSLRQLQLVLYRMQQQKDKGVSLARELLVDDPLNHAARYELWRCTNSDDDKNQFLRTIGGELPVETFLELAIAYNQLGLEQDAIQLLHMAPENAETAYWLAALENTRVMANKPLIADFVFPFRRETGAILQKIVAGNDHWLPAYHLALFYLNTQRTAEAKQMLEKCGNQPDFAAFYVVRSRMKTGNAAEADLLRSYQLDSHPRYLKQLADHYIGTKQADKGLALTEPFMKTHPENYIIGMTHVKLLEMAGHFGPADKMLATLEVIPYEGATDGHELYREAKLMMAIQLLKYNKPAEARKYAAQALEWPEHLGVGKPYDQNIDARPERWTQFLIEKKLKNTKQANTLLNEIISLTEESKNAGNTLHAENALVTLWALEAAGRKQDAETWINQQIQLSPFNAHFQWAKQAWLSGNTTIIPGVLENTNVRLLGALVRLRD